MPCINDLASLLLAPCSLLLGPWLLAPCSWLLAPCSWLLVTTCHLLLATRSHLLTSRPSCCAVDLLNQTVPISSSKQSALVKGINHMLLMVKQLHHMLLTPTAPPRPRGRIRPLHRDRARGPDIMLTPFPDLFSDPCSWCPPSLLFQRRVPSLTATWLLQRIYDHGHAADAVYA